MLGSEKMGDASGNPFSRLESPNRSADGTVALAEIFRTILFRGDVCFCGVRTRFFALFFGMLKDSE